MASQPPRRPEELMGLFNAVMPDDLFTMMVDQAISGSGSEQQNVGIVNLPKDMHKRKIKTKTGEVVTPPSEGFPLSFDMEALMAIPGLTDEQKKAFAMLGTTNEEHEEILKAARTANALAEEESKKNKRIKIRRGGEDKTLYDNGYTKGREDGFMAGHKQGYTEGQEIERKGRFTEHERVKGVTRPEERELYASPTPTGETTGQAHSSVATSHIRGGSTLMSEVTCRVGEQHHNRSYLLCVDYPYYQSEGSRPERKRITADIPIQLIQDAVVNNRGIAPSLMPMAHTVYDTLTISMSGLEALSHVGAIMSVLLRTVSSRAAISNPHELSTAALGQLYDLLYAVGQSKGFEVDDIELALHS